MSHINYHVPRSTGRGGGVAAVYKSDLLITPKPKHSYNSFESLTLSLSHPDSKTQKPVVFCIVYRPPAPYSVFLTEFFEFLSDLVLSTDKVIVVGDFNIHVDVDSNCLSTAFNTLIDTIGFTQQVNEPTHRFNHTLYLVMTYGVEIDNLTVLPQNPPLSDHFLVTFEFSTIDPTIAGKKCYYSRCLSDNAVARFKQMIPSSFASMSCRYTENSHLNPYERVDCFVADAAASLRTMLDTVAPLKKKTVNQRRLAPWYNSEIRSLKHRTRQLERQWRSNKINVNCIAWKDSLIKYKKALCAARKTYYSSLIEENKNNPRFLFSTVARLTKSHSCVESTIPLNLSSNDFMNYFTNKIITIRKNIQQRLLPNDRKHCLDPSTLNYQILCLT
ncbi:uncharacterized protein LOC129603535 [Betta splendens]|uniref:Uncharacterized protein LOC129603535 n=1 Tax=Betta splendens TaxID=158456 RepID=A0A9W2XHY8_BETSP|nr:uncharacterized protein LOC129603535 [Betta splendens]